MRPDTKAVHLRKEAVEKGPMTYRGFQRMVEFLGADSAYDLVQDPDINTDELLHNFRNDDFPEKMSPASMFNKPEDIVTVDEFVHSRYE